MKSTTAVRRTALSGLAAAVLVTLGSVPASAHVTITPSTTAAGATAVLRVEVPHGCAGSATTAMSVRLPEGVADVTARDADGWTVDRSGDALTWTADEPLPDGEHAAVELSVRLPDDPGATLVFPVVQRCEAGEAAWTEVAQDAQDHADLERPAPVVVVTGGGDPSPSASADDADAASAEPSAGSEPASESEPATEPEPVPAPDAAGEGDPLVTYSGLAVLAAGALAGAVALIRRHRQP
ncbi:DUF1775 domain-containing protein [Promicromonospora thailandica]|uniref:Uncharacterized protein YcnI n=1 Tax=Promicromonospora thailandica TaxID=765201 RepID=A0A9X2JTJ8_9MICO|nr:DUF1775 domain-containing protein [Promicromonospora thailandica]MCP2263041.1 Uncharacterized protein YcnI [Promicromonospora thailandica]BFF18412.1 hypothetical protein GCM10025730_19330 [Promicromonospora thailandica]